MTIKARTLKEGDLISINGITGYFMGLEVHGFSNITGTGNRIIYEGFYHKQHFKIEAVYEYGYTSYELLAGDLTNEEIESIVEWIENPQNHINDKVYQQWIKSI